MPAADFSTFLQEMTSMINEQIAAAANTSVDTAFTQAASVLNGFEKLVRLNVQAVKATIGENAETVQNVLAVKNPQELITLAKALQQQAGDKVIGYSRHLQDIVTATVAELRAANQAQLDAAQQRLVEALDRAFQNAPAGSEAAVAMVKSSFEQAGKAYETARSAAVQMTDTVAANVADVVAKASRSSKVDTAVEAG
jgi:phasin family protein